MSRDRKENLPFLEAHNRVALRSPELPRYCPCCGLRLVWGWLDSELWDPCDPARVHLHRIPRPDQTVSCPNCEGYILN